MARRKRASMREGPLADLFRSTVEPDDPPEAPGRSEQRPPEKETKDPAKKAGRKAKAADPAVAGPKLVGMDLKKAVDVVKTLKWFECSRFA